MQINKKITANSGLRRQLFNDKKVGETSFLKHDLTSTVVFSITGIIFLALFLSVVRLQIVRGKELSERSENNKLLVRKVYPSRGLILDRYGNKIAENIPANRLFLVIDEYKDKNGNIEKSLVRKDLEKLERILGKSSRLFVDNNRNEDVTFTDTVLGKIAENPWLKDILILENLSNDDTIAFKLHSKEFQGLYIDNWQQRNYADPIAFSHLVGYVGKASETDIENLLYVDFNDIVGKSGIERQYDNILIGKSGLKAVEVDAYGDPVSGVSLELEKNVSGSMLFLTIDSELQAKLYEILKNGAELKNSTAGAAIVEDIHSGEILALVSYPGFDINKFVQGIDFAEYQALMTDDANIFTPRAIAGQQPPGSIFKTIVLAAALDKGAIDENTRYLSRADFQFSDGTGFYEYNKKAYGNINVVDALEVSSNIFTCETILHWDMDELVPYIEKFGIGRKTGIDIPGEADGRVPSPHNKIWLAENGFYWLDPIWYPEGDSCNSVIGQGITLVTPIQAVNWVSAIANGGTLYKPHLAMKSIAQEKKGLSYEEKVTEYGTTVINKQVVKSEALELIREGMHESIVGEHGSSRMINGLPIDVAVKTGTAEYGKRNENGEYEHMHAWVIGFYPYDEPKYAFVFFLEDGGKSDSVLRLVKEFLTWESRREGRAMAMDN